MDDSAPGPVNPRSAISQLTAHQWLRLQAALEPAPLRKWETLTELAVSDQISWEDSERVSREAGVLAAEAEADFLDALDLERDHPALQSLELPEAAFGEAAPPAPPFEMAGVARALFRMGDYEKALDAYELIERMWRAHPVLLLEKANTLDVLDRSEAAWRACRQLRPFVRDQDQAYRQSEGRRTEAPDASEAERERLWDMVALETTYAQQEHCEGRAATALGRDDGPPLLRSAAGRATSLLEDDAFTPIRDQGLEDFARTMRCGSLALLGEAGAREDCAALSQAYPEEGWYLAHLGLALAAQDETEAATRSLERAVQIDPNNRKYERWLEEAER